MDFKMKVWEIEVGDRDTLIPFEFYTVNMPSLNGAKRKIKDIADELPALQDALGTGRIKWDTPSDYRDADIPVEERIVRGTVGNVYIHITLLAGVNPDNLVDEPEPENGEPFNSKVIWAVASVVAIAYVLMTVYLNTQTDSPNELRTAMLSTYPEYGKRVLRICDEHETIDYRKLRWIVNDFNKEVLKLERAYPIHTDLDNMIRLLTQNQYELKFVYLLKTSQHPSYKKGS